MALKLTDKQYYAPFNSSTWAPRLAYAVGDVVAYNNNYYTALMPVTEPSDALMTPDAAGTTPVLGWESYLADGIVFDSSSLAAINTSLEDAGINTITEIGDSVNLRGLNYWLSSLGTFDLPFATEITEIITTEGVTPDGFEGAEFGHATYDTAGEVTSNNATGIPALTTALDDAGIWDGTTFNTDAVGWIQLEGNPTFSTDNARRITGVTNDGTQLVITYDGDPLLPVMSSPTHVWIYEGEPSDSTITIVGDFSTIAEPDDFNWFQGVYERPEDNPNPEDSTAFWELIEGAEDALGENRFISLEDIVNNYMVLFVDDDMHGSQKRMKIEAHAQRVIQEFSYDTFKVKEIEYEIIDIPQVVMPKDFVELVGMNFVDEYGSERWMIERRDSSNPLSWAQSEGGNILTDSNGNLIAGDSSLTKQRWGNAGKYEKLENNQQLGGGGFGLGFGSGLGDIDGRKFWLDPELQHNAYTYVINERQGVIEVDPRLLGMSNGPAPVGGITMGAERGGALITLHYISDGLSSDLSEVKVHKFAEQAVYDNIYSEDIMRKANVPANEKQRAQRRAYATKRTAKLRLGGFSPRDLKQTLRAQAIWIKT